MDSAVTPQMIWLWTSQAFHAVALVVMVALLVILAQYILTLARWNPGDPWPPHRKDSDNG